MFTVQLWIYMNLPESHFLSSQSLWYITLETGTSLFKLRVYKLAVHDSGMNTTLLKQLMHLEKHVASSSASDALAKDEKLR